MLNQRVSFTDRQALPETAGVYAWWVVEDPSRDGGRASGDIVRPLYLGASANLAASIAADARGIKATALRRGLAMVLAEELELRPRTSIEKLPLNKYEHTRIDHWISAHLLISWSELPQPGTYLDALVRALDPQLRP